MKGQLKKAFTNTNSDKKDDFKTEIEIEKSDALLFKKSP